MTSLDTQFCAAGRIVIRTIGGESLLVPISGAIAGQCVYPLNETAKVVWECLNANQNLREIIAELTRRFEVSATEAETDCRDLLRAFQNEGLITAVETEETSKPKPLND